MKNFTIPVRFKQFYKKYHNREFSVLDIGCGNHSVTLFKRYFPQCKYYGVDRDNYNNNSEEFSLMEKFYKVNLQSDSLDQIPDESFDLINLSHVIEHLTNGMDIIKKLCTKLKKKGSIYIEYPGIKSINLPSGEGTLNFFDDDTHVRLYSIIDLCNILMENDCVIKKAGTLYDPMRIIGLPIQIMINLYRVLTGKKIRAKGLWYVLGFAEFIYAESKSGK
jgi:SAM-dependent methyltransferase